MLIAGFELKTPQCELLVVRLQDQFETSKYSVKNTLRTYDVFRNSVYGTWSLLHGAKRQMLMVTHVWNTSCFSIGIY